MSFLFLVVKKKGESNTMLSPPVARQSKERRFLQYLDRLSHGTAHKLSSRDALYYNHAYSKSSDQALPDNIVPVAHRKMTDFARTRSKRAGFKQNDHIYYVATDIAKEKKKRSRREKKIQKQQAKQLKQLKKAGKHKRLGIIQSSPLVQHTPYSKEYSNVDFSYSAGTPGLRRPVNSHNKSRFLKRASLHSTISPYSKRARFNQYSKRIIRPLRDSNKTVEHVSPVPFGQSAPTYEPNTPNQQPIDNYVLAAATRLARSMAPESRFNRLETSRNPINRLRARFLKTFVVRKRDILASFVQVPVKILNEPDKSLPNLMKICLQTAQLPLMWWYSNRGGNNAKHRRSRIGITSDVPFWNEVKENTFATTTRKKTSRLRRLVSFKREKLQQDDSLRADSNNLPAVFASLAHLARVSGFGQPLINEKKRKHKLSRAFQLLKRTTMGIGKVIKLGRKKPEPPKKRVALLAEW